MPPAVKRRLVTLAAAASLLLCVATSGPSSRPTPSTITIVGSVLDADGNPAAEFPLELRRASNPGEGPERTLAKCSTRNDGSFVLADVPVHPRYSLVGGTTGMGWIFQRVYGRAKRELDVGRIQAVRMDPEHRPR
jgi:hypothetical protein